MLRLRPSIPLPLTALVLALMFSLLWSTGCSDETTEDGRPLVVTTVPILYSLTANLTGDELRLENLLPPGTSPHQVSFDPAQARLIAEADLVIMNGAGLDVWVEELVEAAAGPDLEVLEATEGIDFLAPTDPMPVLEGETGSTDGNSGTPGDEPHEDDEHLHAESGVDPHVWLDVGRARIMVENIRDALADLDPANAELYRERAQAYSVGLDALHEEIATALADLPHKRFVSFHSAFQYYAEAYGLEQVAVIAQSPGREPSPQYLARLVDLVRDLDVPAVFTEPQFSPRPAETLARETGVQTYEIDPEGAPLAPGGYEELMRRNTAVFVEALGGTND